MKKTILLLSLAAVCAFAQTDTNVATNINVTLSSNSVALLQTLSPGTNAADAVQMQINQVIAEKAQQKMAQDAFKVARAYRQASPAVQAQVKALLQVP